VLSRLELWDMLEVVHLFDGRDEDGQHNNRINMHKFISLLVIISIILSARVGSERALGRPTK